MDDLYVEERKASTRTHILYMYGRFEQLKALGLLHDVAGGLTAKGRGEFEGLMGKGFVPSRQRLEDVLLYVGELPGKLVPYVADLMMEYDWLMEELKADLEEGG